MAEKKIAFSTQHSAGLLCEEHSSLELLTAENIFAAYKNRVIGVSVHRVIERKIPTLAEEKRSLV